MRISKKLCKYITASQIGIAAVACVGLGYLSTCFLTQTVVNSDYVIFIIISVFIALLSLVTVGLISFSVKLSPKKSAEEVTALLKRFKEGSGFTCHSCNEADEIASIIEEMMSDLHRSLQSILIKVRTIDQRGEELTKGIHQVAAEQANLLSLNAAIGSVRPKLDGFSVVYGELLSLIELSGCLTGDIRETATQLRAKASEVSAELEYLLIRVAPSPISAPSNEDVYDDDIDEDEAASTAE